VATRIFCGNLSYDLDEAGLREFFESRGFAVTESEIVYDKQSKRSRGFGFITLNGDKDDDNAVELLSDQDVAGRRIRLELARSKGKKGER
jgi:nucleolin